MEQNCRTSINCRRQSSFWMLMALCHRSMISPWVATLPTAQIRRCCITLLSTTRFTINTQNKQWYTKLRHNFHLIGYVKICWMMSVPHIPNIIMRVLAASQTPSLIRHRFSLTPTELPMLTWVKHKINSLHVLNAMTLTLTGRNATQTRIPSGDVQCYPANENGVVLPPCAAKHFFRRRCCVREPDICAS